MFKFRVSEMPFPGLWEGRRIHFTIGEVAGKYG